MRLVVDARTRAILRRVPVTKVYSGVELLLIALLAVQAARLVWTIVTPIGPVGAWRPEQSALPGSPQAILHGFDPFFRISGGDAAGPAVVTTLQLTLFGTRIDAAQGGGSAIIAGPDGVQQSVGVGQEIMPGVRLKAVAFDHVTIDRGGAAEDLYLVQPDQPVVPPLPIAAPLVGGAGPSAPVAPVVGTTAITLADFRRDVRIIPRIDNGRVTGLTVGSQGTSVAFRASGLHEGDVITRIGGRPVGSVADLERLGTQVAQGGSVALTVERGSDTLSLPITITGQ